MAKMKVEQPKQEQMQNGAVSAAPPEPRKPAPDLSGAKDMALQLGSGMLLGPAIASGISSLTKGSGDGPAYKAPIASVTLVDDVCERIMEKLSNVR